MSLDFKISIAPQALAELHSFVAKLSDKTKLRTAALEIGLLMERNIVAGTPVRTGIARGSIQLSQVNESGAVVSGSAKYLPSIEEGTRAHVIRPKNAKVLAFNAGGQKIFAKSVKHPGTPARHMFRDGVKATEPKVIPILKKHLGVS